MKNSKLSFAAGMILGMVLLSGSLVFAAGSLEVIPSADNVYLNGERVQLRGYIVNGHNYFMLQDMSDLLGFGLRWDNDLKQVHMTTKDTQAHDIENAVTEQGRHAPQAGDVIHCDDGSNYKVTDVSRYDHNVFAEGPVGSLPQATCRWELFPEPEMPEPENLRIKSGDQDSLFVRNAYETRRMQYTIYNALGREDSAWSGDKPLATVKLRIPSELVEYTESFWPWRASELEDLVHSRPISQYYVEAWDYYLNGVFQYTRYCVVSQ